MLPLIQTGVRISERQSYHPSHEISRKSMMREILTRISYHDLFSIPNGWGGRIGVLPRYPNGDYLVNLSNRGLWGDFGGGVKAREYHIDALERELQEEVPEWRDYLLSLLPQAEIYSLEEFFPHDYKRSKRTIRVKVLCIVDVPDSFPSSFSPSEEVISLRRVSDLNDLTLSMNLGLSQLLRVLDDTH